MTSRPRWLRADTAYCGVQRTVDRQFFFKPDEAVRNIIGASAARAMLRFPVKLYWLDFNIDHKQDGVAALSNDPGHLGNLVRFEQLFNSLVAREVNRLLCREGAVFSTRNRTDEAVDDPSLEQQLLYAVTNPVKDGLVERVAHWKGFSSYEQLATGEIEQFTYVDRTAWHKAGGVGSRKPAEAFTKTVTLALTPIPSWSGLSAAKRQALFRRRVREAEQFHREERERAGREVMGPVKLAKLDHRDRPRSAAKESGRQPLCHASTAEGAAEYERAYREYLDRYGYASQLWRAEAWEVEFPSGSFRPPLIRVCV